MILITGAARSGTSLTTQILKALGANLGRDEDVNRLYENMALREWVIKTHLAREGYDPMGQDPLPPLAWDTEFDPDTLEQLSMYSDLLMQEEYGLAAYKDAKITLMWKAWARAFPDARWVIVRRRRSEIVGSCLRTSFMRKRKSREAWEAWVAHHEAEFINMKQAGLNLIEVWPSDFIDDPDQFAPVAEFCGFHRDRRVVEAAINPDLFKRN